jgi:hypothetical protein
MATETNLENAPEHSIWRITGRYRGSAGTFTDCLAIVLPEFVHGTDETALAMLPPLGGTGAPDVVTPADITWAQLVVLDPWADAEVTD